MTDKVWAGTTAVRMHRGLPLPERYETARGVAIVSAKPMSLAEITAAITDQTGIPTYLADSAGGSATGAGGGGGDSGGGVPLAYEGALSGLLERVAASYGVSWRYDGSSITIRRFETRVFTIEALPGTQEIQEGVQDDTSSASSGGSGSSGSSSSTNSITQNSKFSISFKNWDELGQIVTSMLNGTGSIVVSPSVGTITVTTTPEIMRTVADYIAKENMRLSRQIAVNIEVYSVDLADGLDFSIAFKTALKSLSNFGANLSSGVGVPADAGGIGSKAASFNLAILNPSTTGQITDTFTALSSIGDTTKVAKFPLITLNNRPASRRIGTDIAYLASSSVTSSSSTTLSGPTVTLTPGTVHQGFSVQVTPRLLDDGRILLQYSLSIIDLVKMHCFSSTGIDCTGNATDASGSSAPSSSGSSIQAPETSNRIFVQQSVLKSGSTLIIGGAEQETTQQNAQGVGDPFNFLLGGGSSSGKTHTMVFFSLTPQVLDAPHSEQD